MPELNSTNFPEAVHVGRPGQINAWDNEEFVNAVKKTGKKQLIVAGVVTEVGTGICISICICAYISICICICISLPYVTTTVPASTSLLLHHVLKY
jgi:hypothetical protein